MQITIFQNDFRLRLTREEKKNYLEMSRLIRTRIEKQAGEILSNVTAQLQDGAFFCVPYELRNYST